MSAISNFLTFLRSAIYAIDVRDGIADAIEQCYKDVNNPTLKTEALEAALQTKIDEGEMAALTIGDHTITAAKLAQGVIDNTLATSGAAADAKKTGDELTAIKADLGAQTGIFGKTAGYYINLTVDPVDTDNPSESSTGLTYSIIDCSEGDKFVINAVGATSGRAWGFLDSGNHVLSMADANATVTDLELTTPANAVKLVINDKGDGMSYKVGNNLASRVSEIEKGGSGLSNDAKEALLTCIKHIAWSDAHGRDCYDALERALYVGVDLPVIYWNYSLGRVPSINDMITTGTTGSQSITFNQNRGVYITGGSGDSDNIRFWPTEYSTCKKAYVETAFTIPAIVNTGGFAVRLSNGVSSFNCSMGMVLVNNALVFRLMYVTGDDNHAVVIPQFTPKFNTEYKLRVEYENGGTNRIYIDDALLYETQDIATKWTAANRIMATGGVSVYIKSIKWGIEEV